MNILERYVSREILATFFAVITILIAILLTQRLALYLNEASSGGLAPSAIFSLVGLQLIRFITELLPLTFLLSAIIALGRLYKDSEMAAMFALGVPITRFYKVLMMLGIPLAIIITLLNFFIVPEVAKTQDVVLHKARESAQLTILKPGVFRTFNKQHTVYVESISKNGEMLNNVFIYTNEYLNGKWAGFSVTTAKEGEQHINEEGTRFIVLHNGSRYTEKGEVRERLYFKESRIQLEESGKPLAHKALSYSTKELFEQPTGVKQGELHRRIAGPLSLFILIIMIPAFAHSQPRQGAFNKMIGALILYVIYFNLLGVGQTWLKQGKIPAQLGLWWVHGIMLLIAIIIAFRFSRRL